MAQAARLSLRLQKELKLLLSDPPPGAAFPHLSSSSLSSIVAQIQGPEETAYAGGIFTVKIEIPDRYPFQPPCVTFATPIYHPNIDTGGRICLDILNLPPKGAWQPSLNISTVITSIGLLLSEPNPDDGLMCDASREYKYNRREFDRKTREMTEKYAKAAAVSESSVSDAEFQSLASPNALERGPEVDTTGHESKFQATESVVAVKEVDVRLEVKTFSDGSKHDAIPPVTSHKKLIGKLSLESSVPSCERDAHIKRWEVPEDKMEVDETEKLLNDSGSSKCNLSQEKLCGSRRKLSLGALSQSQEKSDNDRKKIDQYPSVELQNLSVPNSGSLMPRSDNSCKQGRHRSQDSILPEDNINFGSKKPRHVGNKQILGSLSRSEVVNENKDEIVFSPQLPPSHSHTNLLHKPLHAPPTLGSVKNTHMIDGVGNASSDTSLKRLCLTGKKLSLGLRGSSQIQEKDDKENVAPRMSEYNGLGSKNADENATHKKLGIAQSEENNSSMRPSKSLPNNHQDFRAAEKHPQNYIDIITKTTNQKKADEPSGHESESVIVLDSEDSDEEKTTRVKSKPVLARKRLGRWRVRT